MKAVVYTAAEQFEVTDIPIPEPGPGEVRFRVELAGVCGTDLHVHDGSFFAAFPLTPGHEPVGIVDAVGEGVEGFTPGQRIVANGVGGCGHCANCRRGYRLLCSNLTALGVTGAGGFAEYMIVPRQVLQVDGLNRIPDNVGFDEASAAEPLACAINAQRLLGIEAGDVVVVFGAGPIGCMHIRVARGVHGAGQVYLVDVNAERLAMSAEVARPDGTIDASQVDVVERVLELTGGRGADVIITATAAKVAQTQAVAMAARNGRISFFGGLAKNDPVIELDSNVVHYRQLHIHGANGSAPEHNKRALEYISTGQVPVKDLITHHVPLENVLEAFDLVRSGTAIKVTVEP